MYKREGTFLVQLFALSSKIGQNWTKKRASWTKGYYSYEKDVDLAKLEAKFKEVFNDHYDQHVTLPIAAGKINRID